MRDALCALALLLLGAVVGGETVLARDLAIAGPVAVLSLGHLRHFSQQMVQAAREGAPSALANVAIGTRFITVIAVAAMLADSLGPLPVALAWCAAPLGTAIGGLAQLVQRSAPVEATC
jgi:hypothetical protein